jgi:hypothetical protein
VLPALAPPAQGLVVGVVVVGIRDRSSIISTTTQRSGSRSAAMAELLLLLLLLLQLLRRDGHLHRLAVAARPAPPLAARRPRPYRSSDPGNALLLQGEKRAQIRNLQANGCTLRCMLWIASSTETSGKEAVVARAEARSRASTSRKMWPISGRFWLFCVGEEWRRQRR